MSNSNSPTMRTIRVDFADGNHLITEINGTEESIRDYYLGQFFNFGDTDEHPADRMVEAVAVTFLPVHLCDDPADDRPLTAACGANLGEAAASYPAGMTLGAVSRSEVTCADCLATPEEQPRTVNHYEAKVEARRQRYEELAARKTSESDRLYSQARKMGELIPLGQPILVGHHSEKRDRGYRRRIQGTFEKAFKASDTADHYAQKAASVGTGGISSDDPEAVVKLRERIAELEADQARMVAANKVYRSKKLTAAEKVEQVGALGISRATAISHLGGDCFGNIGYASFELSNNSANVKRLRDRLAGLEREAARRPEEAATTERNGYTVTEDPDENRLLIAFPVRVSREVRALLKSRGFRWSPTRSAWSRMLNNASRYTESDMRERLEALLAA